MGPIFVSTFALAFIEFRIALPIQAMAFRFCRLCISVMHAIMSRQSVDIISHEHLDLDPWSSNDISKPCRSKLVIPSSAEKDAARSFASFLRSEDSDILTLETGASSICVPGMYWRLFDFTNKVKWSHRRYPKVTTAVRTSGCGALTATGRGLFVPKLFKVILAWILIHYKLSLENRQ